MMNKLKVLANFKEMNAKKYIIAVLLVGLMATSSFAEKFVVTNNNDSGSGSLREAIHNANANNDPVQDNGDGNGSGNGSGYDTSNGNDNGNEQQAELMDTIIFNIPDNPLVDNEYVIVLDSVLPPIATDLFIDGLSQNGNVVITLSGALIPDMYGLAVGDPNDPTGHLSTRAIIDGLIFKGFRKGIDTYSRVHDTHVKNCRFEDLSFTGIDTHTHGKVWHLNVENCHFENIDSTALMLYQAKDPYIHNSTFINNGSVSITALDCQRVRIDSNLIMNSDLGIIVDDNCDRGWIRHNTIDAIKGTAISVANSIKFYIEDNTIINNLNDGIYIENTSETYVLNNYIGTDSTNALFGNTGNGISVNGYSYDMFIERNTIGVNGKAGLYVDHDATDSEIEIQHNFIGLDSTVTNHLGNGYSGIELDTAWNTFVFQNTIAYNGRYGIELNFGDYNTFSQNEIYRNVEKPIFIDGASDTQIHTWPNNSILTPSIAAVYYNGTSCTVVVKAESNYEKIELFEGDSATLDAYRYLTDNFLNEQTGFWRGTFDWSNSDNLNFRATVTDSTGSTSEIGWSCYIVTDTLDARAGSFREALICANYDGVNNGIIFDMPDHTERTIRPWTPYPDVEHHITVIPVVSDSIKFSGVYGTDFSGLVFTGNNDNGTCLSNFIIQDFTNGISVEGNSSLKVDNLTLKDNSENGIIVASDIDSLCIINSTIYANDSSGVLINPVNSSYAEIDKNHIYGNLKEGLCYAMTSDNTIITENFIHDNTLEGIYTNGGRLNHISRNSIFGNALSGIKIDNTRCDSIATNQIGFYTDTLLANLLGEEDTLLANLHGLEILGDSINLIINNEIVHNNGNGILISGKNTIIENNYIGLFRDYTPGGDSLNGISGIDATNLIIRGNYIGNNQEDGILGCNNSIIINNKIGGLGINSLIMFGNQKTGIRGGLNCVISQNTFISNFESGLILDTVAYQDTITGTDVNNNIFAHNRDVAIAVLNTRQVEVKNNIISTSDLGILGNEISDIEIYNNKIDSIRGTAIEGMNSENILIERNHITNCLNEAILIRNIVGADITNNLIGIDSVGTLMENSGDGISMLGNTTGINVSDNTIGASGKSGIYINLSTDTGEIIIENNFIGFSEELGTTIANSSHGIELDTAWNVDITRNIVAFNGGSGIYLNHGYGNIFSQNKIYHNLLKPIGIEGTETEQSWANNTIFTPSVAYVSYEGGEYKVVVKSEPDYERIEVFKGKGTTINAFEFISDDFTHLGDGFWEANISMEESDSLVFTVSATSTEKNTSELGQSCLIVNNTSDGGAGSLRDAIGCANYHSGLSEILLDLTYNPSKVIKVESQLPDILYPIFLEAELSDSITISGINNPSVDGVVFKGSSTDTKSELSGLFIEEFKNGIRVDGTDGIRLQNLVVKNNLENGIVVSADIDSLWVNSSHIYSNDSCGISIHQVSPTFVEINDNEIDNNAVAGIFYAANSGGSVISNNLIHTNATEGIYTKNGRIGYIRENNIYGNEASGIKIDDTQIDSVLNNQVGIDTNGEIVPNNTGFEVSGNNDVLINSNEIVGNHAEGMLLSSSNTVITNNYIGLLKDYTPAANGSHGISGQDASDLIIEGNYIGNNAGDGILGCNNSIISNNKIGGYIDNSSNNGALVSHNSTLSHIKGSEVDTEQIFGNQGAGMRGSTYTVIYQNVFADNTDGGLILSTDQNKISECLFFGEQEQAIDLPEGAKQPAIFGNNYVAQKEYIVLKGTATNADSVEIFYCLGKEQTALRFVGRTKTNSNGTWELTIPSGKNYNFQTPNYYVNTATSTNGKTSELGAVIQTMDNLCGQEHYLSPENRGNIFICPDGFKTIICKDKNYSYSWVHKYSATQDSIYSTSRIVEFSNEGLYILTVKDTVLDCEVMDTLHIEQLDEDVRADFLMNGEAGVNDKIVLVETTFPMPDTVVWNFSHSQVEFIDNNPVISFVDVGYYEITLTAYVGSCSGTITKGIYIGEESKAYVDGFVYPYKIISASAYPLPVQGILNISAELSEECDLRISLFNNKGLKLEEEEVKNVFMDFNHEINMTNYGSGVYYVKISDGISEKRVLKVVK